MPENHMDDIPRRRRRRKRRPKWQRMLRKYWPPIRFGLICAAMLLVIVLSIKGIITGIVNANQDRQEQLSSTSEPTEPTLSPEELKAMAEEIAKKADSMAAGFDYLGAIELIESFEQYKDYDFLTSKIPQFEQLDSELVSYPDMNKITHVFFHSLIVDTARAFDGERTQTGYNQYMTTIAEFEAMLEAMYEKGYIHQHGMTVQ